MAELQSVGTGSASSGSASAVSAAASTWAKPAAAAASAGRGASAATGAASSPVPFDAVDGAVGLGVDIVEIARMRAILDRSPMFARKVFSSEECCYCDATSSPETHYATRFAAKEAVLKALGTGFSQGIGVRDVEVRRTSKGRPYAHLSGRAREVARELGVRELPLSLSYTHTEAVACAMAITEDSVRAQKRRVDQTEELARRFKEARTMLDDLDSSAGAPAESASESGAPAGNPARAGASPATSPTAAAALSHMNAK